MKRAGLRRWLAVPMAILTVLAVVPYAALGAPAALGVQSGTQANTTAQALVQGAPNQLKVAAKLTLHVLNNASGHAIANNTARARANCDGCIAAAVSIQIVLVTSGDVKPSNHAYSTNRDCDTCVGLAVARQIVITVKGGGSFTAATRQRLATLRAELTRIDYRRTSAEALEDKVDNLADRMARVVLNGFVGASGSALPERLCGVAPDASNCVGAPTVRGVVLTGVPSTATFDARGKNLAHSFQHGTSQAATLADSRQIVLADPGLRLRAAPTPASFRNEAITSTVGLGVAPRLIHDNAIDYDQAFASMEDCAAAPASCAQPSNVNSVVYSQANQWLFGSLPTNFGRNEASSLLVGNDPATLPVTTAMSTGSRRDAYRAAVREAQSPDVVNRPQSSGPTASGKVQLGNAGRASVPRLPFVGKGVSGTGVAGDRSTGIAIALQYTLAPPRAGCQDVASSQIPIGDVVSIPGTDRVIACGSSNQSGAVATNVATGDYDNVAVSGTARFVGAPDEIAEGPVALILNSRNSQGMLGFQLAAGGGGESCDVIVDDCSVLVALAGSHSQIVTQSAEQSVAPASLHTLVRGSDLLQIAITLTFLSNGIFSLLDGEQATLTVGHPLTSPATNEYVNDDLEQWTVQVDIDSDSSYTAISLNQSTATID